MYVGEKAFLASTKSLNSTPVLTTRFAYVEGSHGDMCTGFVGEVDESNGDSSFFGTHLQYILLQSQCGQGTIQSNRARVKQIVSRLPTCD